MAHKLQAQFPSVIGSKNYMVHTTGVIHTGTQILNLLEVATPVMQAVILLDIEETEAPATKPESKYGV